MTLTVVAVMLPVAARVPSVTPLLTYMLPATVVTALVAPNTLKMLAVVAFKFVEKIFVEKIFGAQRLPEMMRLAPRATGAVPTPMLDEATSVEVLMRFPVNVPLELKLVDMTFTVLRRFVKMAMLVMLAVPATLRFVMDAAVA